MGFPACYHPLGLPRSRWQRILAVCITIATLGGCGGAQQSPTPAGSLAPGESVPATAITSPSTPLKVVTTIVPLSRFTQAVAGDRAKVIQLLPANTGPHDFQAKPQDLQTLTEAQVLVENGLGLEGFLADLIQNANNPHLAIVNTSVGVPPLANLHAQAGGAVNPHIWLDPQRAILQVKHIRDGLMAADPGGAAIYSANAAAYIQQLQALDREFSQSLAPYRGQSFITFHDFARYFADRYGLKAAFLVDIPEENPTPQDLQRTMALVKAQGIKALLTEPLAGKDSLRALATDLGVTISEFDPMETGDLHPQAYFQVMRQNVQNLEQAIGRKVSPSPVTSTP